MARVTITIRHKVMRFRTVMLRNKRGIPQATKMPFEVEETKKVSLDRAIYDRLENPTVELEKRLGLRITRTKVEMEDA